MAQTNTSIKRTKAYKTLVAILKSEDKALAAYKAAHGEPEPEVSDLDRLISAGFTREQAEKALGSTAPVAAAEEVKVEAPAPVTSRSLAEALVEDQGFNYAKGRVYVTADTIEAQVRVRKTGRAEIVASSGVGRTKAVLIYKEESGDVALQNLTR